MIKKICVNDILRISKQNEVNPLHIILGTRSQKKLGEITNIDLSNTTSHFQLQNNDELSFDVYEYMDGQKCSLWNEIINFRLVWIKEYDEWFEINVAVDDSQLVTKKIVTCTSLCEAELSQTNMDATEINTEDDPNWTDDKDLYVPTVFYNDNRPEYSLLHRVLKKVPNYTIKHVDSSLCNIQRTFSISNTTNVCDCLRNTIATEIGCLFLFDSNERGIYVYDLETTCLECGERYEEDVKVCSCCGSTALSHPYGNNTAIYVDKENLGNSLQVQLDAGSVKNCFKVQGGDDNINAAIRNVNPNASNYIYVLSDDVRHDMPSELVEKFDDYYKLVDEYNTTKEFVYDSEHVQNYNEVINKVKELYKDNIIEDDDFFPYDTLSTNYNGYSNVTRIFYDTVDLKLYLHDAMMPTFIQAEENANQQLQLLLANLSPVSLEKFKNCTQASAESAIKVFARAIIDTSRFKISVKTTDFVKNQNETALWTGNIIITNYSDEDDIAEYEDLNVSINADYPNYLKQMVEKLIAKVDINGIKDIFDDDLTLDEFKEQIKLYCYASLDGFYNAYQTCLDLFVEANISQNPESKLYEQFYKPYFDRFKALEEEMAVRSKDIEAIEAIQNDTVEIMNTCENELDFQKYLGDELYCIFLNYRREDTYKNENYVSDGLTNTEIIQKANELMAVAKKELRKSNTKQYFISGNINNLLLIKDDEGNKPFEEWLNDFALGNYIHTKIGGTVYNMRLADISFSYGNLDTLNVTFYDVTQNGTDEVSQAKKILTTAKTVGSTYNSTKKQASQGQSANEAFNRLQKEGLNSAQYNIYNENVTVLTDEHGILCRIYDDITEEYSPNQSRLGASGLIFTNNGWETTVTALGRQSYTLNNIKYEEYGVNSQFCIAGKIIAGDIYSANWETNDKNETIKGTHINLGDGSFDFAGGKLKYNATKDELSVNGIIKGGSIQSLNYVADTSGSYINLDNGSFQFGGGKLKYDTTNSKIVLSGEITASTFTGGLIKSNDGKTQLNLDNGTFSFANGNLKYSNNLLEVSGKLTATSGSIGGWTINSSSISASNTTLSSNGTITCNYLIAKNQGTIGNWTISSSGLSGGNLSGANINGASQFYSSLTTPFSGGCVSQIGDIVANKITALNLDAKYATIDSLSAGSLTIDGACIKTETITSRAIGWYAITNGCLATDSVDLRCITTDAISTIELNVKNQITYQGLGMDTNYGSLIPAGISVSGTHQVLDTDGNQISVLGAYVSSSSGRPYLFLEAG